MDVCTTPGRLPGSSHFWGTIAVMAHEKTGSASGIDKSPGRRAKDARARRSQEKRWARKSGPVATSFVCPRCAGPHPLIECPSPDPSFAP